MARDRCGTSEGESKHENFCCVAAAGLVRGYGNDPAVRAADYDQARSAAWLADSGCGAAGAHVRCRPRDRGLPRSAFSRTARVLRCVLRGWLLAAAVCIPVW